MKIIYKQAKKGQDGRLEYLTQNNYVMYVDIGDIPPDEVEPYFKKLDNIMKSFSNQETEYFFIARRYNKTDEIVYLPGGVQCHYISVHGMHPSCVCEYLLTAKKDYLELQSTTK